MLPQAGSGGVQSGKGGKARGLKGPSEATAHATFYDAAVSGADPVVDRPGFAEMQARLFVKRRASMWQR